MEIRRGILSAADLIQLGAVTQPWMQSGVPPVAKTREASLQLRFVHLRTHISYACDDPEASECKALGSTVWVSPPLGGAPTVLAFDWALIERRSILVVHNPLTISSNLVLLGPDGAQLPATERLGVLMDLAHGVNWQEKVEEHLPPELLTSSAAVAH